MIGAKDGGGVHCSCFVLLAYVVDFWRRLTYYYKQLIQLFKINYFAGFTRGLRRSEVLDTEKFLCAEAITTLLK